MAPRLPVPGSDSGDWGTILNDFLTQEFVNDGSNNSGKLKMRFNGELDAKYIKPSTGIPESDLAVSVQNKLNNSIPSSSGIQTVMYVAGNYPARPSTGVVMWVGPVQPSNWQQNDLWLKTS